MDGGTGFEQGPSFLLEVGKMSIEELTARVQRIEADFDNLRTRQTELEKDVHADNIHRVNVERRLAAIEDILKWLTRLMIGALIVGILALVINNPAATLP